MSRTRFVVVSVCLALAACKGGDAGEAAKADAKSLDAPVQPAEQAAPPSATEVAASDATGADESESETGEDEEPAAPLPASFEAIGVAECDDYVKDHVACIDSKVPEVEREAARRVVFNNLEVWKQTAAGGPSAQKGLQTACKIAREQAKRATQDLGCEW